MTRSVDPRPWTINAAQHDARAESLLVDYYRVRRQVAYPLPVRCCDPPAALVPGIAEYPWSTWLTWALEDRLGRLGLAAEWGAPDICREVAERDLHALCDWPSYLGFRGTPGLDSAHVARIMTRALGWTWPDEALRGRLQASMRRLIDESLPVLRPTGDPRHNIPLIALLGAAMSSRRVGHDRAAELADTARTAAEAWLQAHFDHYTEGVAYDGYVLEFLLYAAQQLDWPLAEHEAMPLLVRPTLELGVPGRPCDVAPLGDVEPYEMAFHVGAVLRLAGMRPDLVPGWYLDCVADGGPAVWRNIGAVEALDALAWESGPVPDDSDPVDTGAAIVVRSGRALEDLAVVAGAPRCGMGHLHSDSGSLLLGHAGRWWIDDPGYQQYAPGDEREFTVGVAAHNSPLLDGAPALGRAARVELARGRIGLDLSDCYDGRSGIVRRDVFMVGRRAVAVADRTDRPAAMLHHWHLHPELYWWPERDRVRLCHPDGGRLDVALPASRLRPESIERHAGSRGQMTLRVEHDPTAIVWTVFGLGRTVVTQASVVECCFSVDGESYTLVLPELARISA